MGRVSSKNLVEGFVVQVLDPLSGDWIQYGNDKYVMKSKEDARKYIEDLKGGPYRIVLAKMYL